MATRKPLNIVSGVVREIASGDTIEPAILGTGTRDGTKFLRDDGVWSASTGGNPEVVTPANVSPADGAIGVMDNSTFSGDTYYSMYSASQSAIRLQISTSTDFTTPLYSSGDQAAGISFSITSGIVSTSTTYYWRVSYKNSRGTYSAWSTPTSFTTADSFNDYIPTPSATPSLLAAFEGGFYFGMIWNELVQSTTSTTIGTGSKVFTVASMTATPLVYSGQELEVRSRANPSNKMIGTVTAAMGTSLTLSISSVAGSGTFTDWSIMSKYRLIVAPKSSGESASLAQKNAATSNPSACQTLTEGLKSTLAMIAAGNSTTYPSAHFCTGLNIGGKADWYLPARDELEQLWRNAKPVTNDNYTASGREVSAISYTTLGSYGDTSTSGGTNVHSVPTGSAYTAGAPSQTSVTAFRTSGAECLEFGAAIYDASSEFSSTATWALDCRTSSPGFCGSHSKTNSRRVRAIRRSII